MNPPDPTTPPARVTPIQADREAGKKFLVALGFPHQAFLLDDGEIKDELAENALQVLVDYRLAALSEREQAVREALRKAIETLAASRHLIGKYTLEHHWLAEHDQRIAELKAALAALSALAAPKAEDHPVAGEDDDESMARALWVNLPTTRKWQALRAEERSLAVHVFQRFRAHYAALARPAPDALAEMRELSEKAPRDFCVNPDTPSVIITEAGRISISWSVQRAGSGADHSAGEDAAAFIVAAVNYVRSLLATEGR